MVTGISPAENTAEEDRLLSPPQQQQQSSTIKAEIMSNIDGDEKSPVKHSLLWSEVFATPSDEAIGRGDLFSPAAATSDDNDSRHGAGT